MKKVCMSKEIIWFVMENLSETFSFYFTNRRVNNNYSITEFSLLLTEQKNLWCKTQTLKEDNKLIIIIIQKVVKEIVQNICIKININRWIDNI